MKGGFSFCGLNIGDLGLQYAPELQDTFVYGNADLTVNEESFAARDGGIRYGSSYKPKDFRLRCYFEDKHINDSILDNILNFFTKDKTGKLVFDNRDWCWYNATVMSIDVSNITNYKNGFVTINLRAYYPFARTEIFYAKTETEDGSHITYDEDSDFNSYIQYPTVNDEDPIIDYQIDDQEYLNVNGESVVTTDPYLKNKVTFYSEDVTPLFSFTNVTSSKTVLLYNAGNARASVCIKLKGNAGDDGVVIYNRANGAEAKFIGFTKQATTSASKYILCDSLNGKTILTNGTTSAMMFLYHDYGFIDLIPSTHLLKNVKWTYETGSNTVTSNKHLNETHVGNYIYILGNWHQIVSVTGNNTALIDVTGMPITESGTELSDIVFMNELAIVTSNNTVLDEVTFIYKHTFR